MIASPAVEAAVTERLHAAGCVAATDEAAELVSAAPDAPTLDAWVRRREQGEPLPWITRRAAFCGQWLHIDAGVYVPRFQSEELARRAAALVPLGGRALDLCTGAGAIAAHLQAAVPGATVIGLDIDPVAAACARRNGVTTVVADLASPLRQAPTFDVVTAVAPYVPARDLRLLPADVQRYEPPLALDGGTDGLDLVRQVVTAAAALLRPAGWLLVELGGDQDRALTPTIVASGFDEVVPWHDDEGDLRGVACRMVPEPKDRTTP